MTTPMSADISAPDEVAEAKPPRRLLPSLLLSNVALFSLYLGAAAVLLPTQVAAIDDDPVRKALNLSIVTGAAALVAIFAQPLAGALSDRSRRRNPWILGFGLAGGALAATVALGTSIALLVVLWCVTLLFLNGYQAAVTAVIPDRVPRSKRGIASAIVGVATPLAAVVGVLVSGRLAGTLPLAYGVLGGLIAVSAVVFVLLNREPTLLPGEPVALATQLRGILSALAHRDFRLAFLSRAAVMMSYLIVFHYLLYVVESRVTLPSGWQPVTGVTALTIIAALAMVVGTLTGGILADRLRRYRLFVVVGAALIVVAAIPPLLAGSFAAMVGYVVLMGLGFGCFLAVDTAIVTLVLPKAEDAARDLGILNAANTVPQSLAAFLAGLIVAALGGGPDAYGALFFTSMGFAVLGGLLILGVKGTK